MRKKYQEISGFVMGAGTGILLHSLEISPFTPLGVFILVFNFLITLILKQASN